MIKCPCSETGKVWSACDATKKLPTGNRAAYRREIMEVLAEVKDTSAEFRGYIQNGGSASSTTELVGENVDEDDDEDNDEDDMDLAYSTLELPVVNKCLYLIDGITTAIKFFLQSMSLFDDEIDNIDVISSSVATLRGLVVDTGAELYPPVDIEELAPLSQRLFDETRSFLRILQSDPVLSSQLTSDSEVNSFVEFIFCSDSWVIENLS